MALFGVTEMSRLTIFMGCAFKLDFSYFGDSVALLLAEA